MKTINHDNIKEYQWTDGLGFHQYYCESNEEPGTMYNFKYEPEHRRYSWNDNLGCHQYYL